MNLFPEIDNEIDTPWNDPSGDWLRICGTDFPLDPRAEDPRITNPKKER